MQKYAIFLMGLFLLCGCSSSRPAISTTYYSLGYVPVPVTFAQQLPFSLNIARFNCSYELNSTEIFFSSEPNIVKNYNYSRWRIYPSDMCADFLVRDIRGSNFLLNVVKNQNNASYNLEADLTEFMRIDDSNGSRVKLSLNCTLLDNQAKALAQKIIFSRNYTYEQSVQDESPWSIAQALSQAFTHFSTQIQKDIYSSLSPK